MTENNPFATAEAWTVSTGNMLPVGNHLVTIAEADGGSSSKGNPQIELRFENDEGSIKDWLVYHSTFLGKVVSLFESVGLERPQPGEFDPADNYRLTDALIAKLIGKRVGIVVRDEDDLQNPGKKRTRVKGYVEPAQITDDAPADTRGLPNAGAASQPPASQSNNPIPF